MAARSTVAEASLQHQVADQVPVDHAVVALVAVAQQAVVAGRLAAFLAGAGLAAAAVLAGVRVEVADLQRGAGRPGQRVGVVDQAAEHAGAALGGLG